MSAQAPDNSLASDIIAEIAKKHGVAISLDDPLISVIWLNQALLSRYIEEASRQASSTFKAELEKVTKEFNNISLEKQKELLKAQDELYAKRNEEIRTLIDGQNDALKQVIIRAAHQLSEASKRKVTIKNRSKSPRNIVSFLGGAAFASVLGGLLVLFW